MLEFRKGKPEVLHAELCLGVIRNVPSPWGLLKCALDEKHMSAGAVGVPAALQQGFQREAQSERAV